MIFNRVLRKADYYSVLNVVRTASPKEIKMKYYELSKKYHPDLNRDNKDAEATFVRINEAYSVLSNESKRRDYDRNLALDEAPHAGNAYSPAPGTTTHYRTTYRQRSQINPDDWILYRKNQSTASQSAYQYYTNQQAYTRGHYGNDNTTEWQRKRDEWRARMHGKYKNYEVSDQDKAVRKRMVFRLFCLMMGLMIFPELTLMD